MKKANDDMPRGIRNNNPLNIEHNKANKWYGQVGVDWRDPDDDSKGGYCIFAFPWQGYRAAAILHTNYQDDRLAEDGSAIDTVAEIIQRWAPRIKTGARAGKENPHQSRYIAFVRRKMDVGKGAHVDCSDYETEYKLLEAQGHWECGVAKPFGSKTKPAIRKGLLEANIKPHEDFEPASKDPALKVGKTAVIGGGAALAAVPSIAEVAPAFPILNHLVDKAPWIIAMALVLGAGFMAYRSWRQHRHGV